MLFILFSSLLYAEDKPKAKAKKQSAFKTQGEIRLITTLPPDFVVNTDGDKVGQEYTVDSRARVGLGYKQKYWSVWASGDLFSGHMAGDPWELESGIHRLNMTEFGVTSADNFVIRESYFTLQGGPVRFTGGLNTNQWGMGMIANDGNQKQLFGRADYGDRVARAMVSVKAHKKQPIVFSLGADYLLDDDMVDWDAGQRAVQGLASLLYRPKNGNRLGILGAYRQITEQNDEQTTGFFYDVYGKKIFKTPEMKLITEFEGAFLHGFSDRFSNKYHLDGLHIRAFGMVGRVTADFHNLPVTGHFFTGFASGDGNPDDGQINDFSFDRDYNVGMVLFDHQQSALEVGLFQQLNDPEYSSQPPDGVEALVTEGAAQHTMYLQPAVQTYLISWLEMKAGLLMAWNTAPVSHSFQSYRNGGFPANHLGEQTSGYYLGTEFDWGIGWVGVPSWDLKPRIELQGGHLLPSASLGGDTLHLLMLHTNVSW